MLHGYFPYFYNLIVKKMIVLAGFFQRNMGIHLTTELEIFSSIIQ